MSEMAPKIAKAIFVGNIKGGGRKKHTYCVSDRLFAAPIQTPIGGAP